MSNEKLLINDSKSNNFEIKSNNEIEEMAKALTMYEKKLCDRLPKDQCLLTSAVHAQVSCDYCKIAEFLYNAGYRKQSEGEWISHEGYDECSLCRTKVTYPSNYCSNCGARMKGE